MPPALFNRCYPIDTSIVLLRMVIKKQEKFDQVFVKYDLLTDRLTYEEGLSEFRGDGGFSNDGLLHFDYYSQKAVYVAFYINQITAFDNQLNLAYRGHSIDTVRKNSTNYYLLKKERVNRLSSSSPKRIINGESCVSQGLLFVHSHLMADNENPNIFEQHSVIDIYRIKNGDYFGSFYVPHLNNKQMLRFRVFGNLLYAIYPDRLVQYEMPRVIRPFD